MRLANLVLIILFLVNSFAFCEVLFESPVELIHKKECGIDEFCKNFINDVDIEEFIRNELKNDYVVVSLDECIDVTLKNNFDIQISKTEYKSEKYQYHYYLSKFLPMLSTTSYISQYSGQILVGGVLRDNFQETAISVNITAQHDLTQGGRTIFEAKAAKYFAKSKRHNEHYVISHMLYLTSKYYYEMLLAKINIEIYLRNLIERNAQLALAQNLVNSGFGTKFDVIRSKNMSAQARAELLAALNDFRFSQAKLANIMGIDVQTALMPFEDEIKTMDLVDLNMEISQLTKLAKENREDLKMYSDLIAYEKQVKNVFITDFMPKPLVNFQQQFQGTINTSVNPNYIISGLLYWQPGENLIFGSWNKIKQQKEKIKLRKLEYIKKIRDIEEAIVKAKYSAYFNKQQFEINKARIEYTKNSVKLAMLRFDNGRGILLDVIEAQSEATQAKVEYVNSIIKYNISQLELLYNTGLINKDLIVSNYKP